jgi:hypothetical protein
MFLKAVPYDQLGWSGLVWSVSVAVRCGRNCQWVMARLRV